MTSMPDDYVLGHSSDEYERLRRQAQVLEPATRRVFQSIGLQPGCTCLDVGCGPGESMRLMGEFVGPSGDVTGLDRDRKAGCEAIERLRAAGPSRYHFVEADIETVDQIGGRLFDLTFARLALLFVRDPIAALSQDVQLDQTRWIHRRSGLSRSHHQSSSQARSVHGAPAGDP
jgi:SAM-dependent methyltransferase